MEELEEFPAGNVCMEKHNSGHFSCATSHEQHELCTAHSLSPILVHVGAGMHSQGVCWGVGGLVGSTVDGAHQTSAVLLCQAELPAPSTSPWAGKHPTAPRSHPRCGLSHWSFIYLQCLSRAPHPLLLTGR